MASCGFVFLTAVVVVIFYKILDWLIRRPMLGALHKKCVFITGCDSGFGHNTAKHLDSLGVWVFAGCFTEKGEKDLKKQCSSRLKSVYIDITKTDTIDKAFQFVKKNIPPECRGLWGIVNNAGITGKYCGPPDFLILDDYKHVMDVNAFGMVEVNRIFAPLVKKAKGRIVNTSSVGGIYPLYTASYSMSKFAVESYSDVLRRHLRCFGVTVHIIEPGSYRTGIVTDFRDSIERSWQCLSPEIKEEYGPNFKEDMIKNLIGPYEKNASDRTFEVTEAYMHALFSKFPRARYLVPGKNGRILWILSKFPEWAGDALFEIAMRIKPTPKPSSGSAQGAI